MKTAIIEKQISEKATPLQIIDHLQQRRPIKSKTLELVPIFNAR
jgi:hypothetical protein